MYPVTQDFLNKIKENNRVFEAKIQIQHSTGVLEITDKDLVQGTLVYTEGSQSGEEFTVGGTVASDISFTILKKPGYENINFEGATVNCNIGLLVKEGADAHFLQPSQPSKMPGFEEKWEYVPLGVFNIDEPIKLRNTIEIKAIDNMIKFDLPYSLSKLSYPASLYQIYVNACNVCDVLPGTVSFPNMNYIVQNRPSDELTFRDVIGYVAELAGCFAKCNRSGALEIKWYTPSGITLEPSNRFNFKPNDYEVKIKGVMATVEDTTYLAGEETYAIDLTDNPLLQGGHESVLPNIFNNIKDTTFTPYTSEWQGNPAIQAGDMITQIDIDGKVYNTLITKSTFKYRGRSSLEAKGLPEISRGYKGSTNRRIAQIKRVVEKEIGDKLTTLEEAILNSTELIANMLGGYAIQGEDAFYVADNKDLSKAVKVWKWGIGGFGYSQNGVNGPYTTAITADGSIVAMLVAANIITANMVQTGMLMSNDGGAYFDLDNRVIRVSHDDGSYSQMDEYGFFIQYLYGRGHYLTDFEIIEHTDIGNEWSTTIPNPVRIYIPKRFRGRHIRTFAFPREFASYHVMPTPPYDPSTMSYVTLYVESVDTDISNSNPYVDVISRATVRDDENRRVVYGDVKFNLIIVGV